MKKRIFAMLLAVLMMMPVLFACVKNEDKPEETTKAPEVTTEPSTEPEESTGPSESETKEEVPSDYLADKDFKGTTITMLYWEDYTMNEFFGENDPSDAISFSIYTRNKAVEDRIGIKLDFKKSKGNADNMAEYIKKVETDFADSAVAEYDIYATYSRVSPRLAVKGYTKDLSKLDPIDFSKPWWPSSLVNECTIGGQLHFCSGDISTNMLWMMEGTFFNKELLTNQGIEYPYELVKSGKWTMEHLIALTKDVYEDLDGDDKKSSGDVFGYTVFDTNIDALGTSGGFTSISHDKDGKLIIDPEFFGERMTTYMTMIHSWMNTADGFFHSNKAETARKPFMTGNALFITDRLFLAAGKDNTDSGKTDGLDFKYGIVPNPKYDEKQDYSTNVGHPFTTYSISKKTKLDTEAASTFELLAAEGYRYVTPMVFDVAMQLRYSKDEVDAEMYDIIRKTVRYEIGRLMCDDISTAAVNLFRKTVLAASFSVTGYKTQKKVIQGGVDNVNAAFGMN